MKQILRTIGAPFRLSPFWLLVASAAVLLAGFAIDMRMLGVELPGLASQAQALSSAVVISWSLAVLSLPRVLAPRGSERAQQQRVEKSELVYKQPRGHEEAPMAGWQERLRRKSLNGTVGQNVILPGAADQMDERALARALRSNRRRVSRPSSGGFGRTLAKVACTVGVLLIFGAALMSDAGSAVAGDATATLQNAVANLSNRIALPGLNG